MRMSKSTIAPQFKSGSGCYVIRGGGRVLYVGQSKHLERRWATHNNKDFIETHFPNATVEIVPCHENNLLAVESELINKYHPVLNGRGNSEDACLELGVDPYWWWKKIPAEKRKRMAKGLDELSVMEMDGTPSRYLLSNE
jgi:hypothetical protein